MFFLSLFFIFISFFILKVQRFLRIEWWILILGGTKTISTTYSPFKLKGKMRNNVSPYEIIEWILGHKLYLFLSMKFTWACPHYLIKFDFRCDQSFYFPTLPANRGENCLRCLRREFSPSVPRWKSQNFIESTYLPIKKHQISMR